MESRRDRVRVAWNYSCPRAATERAMQHLLKFDLVGDLSRVVDLLANLTAALLNMPRKRAERLGHFRYAIGTDTRQAQAANKTVVEELVGIVFVLSIFLAAGAKWAGSERGARTHSEEVEGVQVGERT